MVKRIIFNKTKIENFYPTVKVRVDKYFKDKNISKHFNGAMIFKTIFILTIFVGTYALILSNLFSPWIVLLLAMINGFFVALIGINIAHDGVHGAYSSRHWRRFKMR